MQICHLTISTIDYERRIHNQIDTAAHSGHGILVYALGRPGELKIEQKGNYTLRRVFTIFHSGGPLKFISMNLQLFFLLLRRKCDLLHCHDLWVLPAAAAVARLQGCALVYDAHEYYAGLEVFRRKKLSRLLWLLAERIAVKRVQVLLTVSEKLGERFRSRYPHLKQIEIIRNLPKYERADSARASLQIRKNGNKILIYQGHFRPGRGLENLIRAMALTTVRAELHLIGSGELEADLKHLVQSLHQQQRIFFHGFIPTSELISTAAQGDLGIVLFEPNSINYAAALPNKFFEYLMAGLPVLCSNIETLRAYIDKFDCGLCVDPADPEAIARVIAGMVADEQRLQIWKVRAGQAAQELNWENEEKKLVRIYAQFQ